MDEPMVRRTILVTTEVWGKLKRVAEDRRVPIAEFVREGIDAVLDLAEKQQDTIERVAKELQRRKP